VRRWRQREEELVTYRQFRQAFPLLKAGPRSFLSVAMPGNDLRICEWTRRVMMPVAYELLISAADGRGQGRMN
jgi:hypothetical protein